MATYRTADFETALEAKGYRRDQTHHNMFWFFIDGRKTSVRTRPSHQEREFDERLLSERRKQMGLLDKGALLRFIQCTLTGEEYANYLLQTGRIKRPPQADDVEQ